MQSFLYLYFTVCSKRKYIENKERTINFNEQLGNHENRAGAHYSKKKPSICNLLYRQTEESVNHVSSEFELRSKRHNDELQSENPPNNQPSSPQDLFNNFIVSCEYLVSYYQLLGLPIVSYLPGRCQDFIEDYSLTFNVEITEKNVESTFLTFNIIQDNNSVKERIMFKDINWDAALNHICNNTNTNFALFIDKKIPNIKNLCVKIILAILCEKNPHMNENQLKVKMKYKDIFKSNPQFLIFLHYINSQDSSSYNMKDAINFENIKNIFVNLQNILNYRHLNQVWTETCCQEIVKNILCDLLDQKEIATNYSSLQNFRFTYGTNLLTPDRKKILLQFTFFFINYKDKKKEVKEYTYSVKRRSGYFSNRPILVNFFERFKVFINSLDLGESKKEEFLMKIPDEKRISYCEKNAMANSSRLNHFIIEEIKTNPNENTQKELLGFEIINNIYKDFEEYLESILN